MRRALAFLCLLTAPAYADRGAGWLRDRALAEWMVGTGGWRSGLGLDARAPGFSELVAGGEFVLGLDVVSGLGVFVSGRVLAGGGGDHRYLEGLAGTGLQVRVNEWVRLRGGPAAGRATLGDDKAVLVGGFLVASIDLFPLGRGRRVATALALRFDADGHIGAHSQLPDQSIALALGLGVRY